MMLVVTSTMPSEFQYQSWQTFQSQDSTCLPGMADRRGTSEFVDMFGNEVSWVCVIEDVHWADGATLDLLRYLSRRIDRLRLLLVLSYRDDEIGDNTRWQCFWVKWRPR